jgi:prepilin-type processing-associated H-X9-DG protein
MDQEDRIGGRRKAGPGAGMMVALAGCFAVLVVAAMGSIGFLWLGNVNVARPAAQRASCMSNMKQLATGLLMYSQDYDGKFPIAARWDTDVMPYIKNMTILRCPARPVPNGYAFNSRLSGVDSALFSNAANVPMLFESSMGSPGTADPLTSFVAPHNGNGGVSYADGHVAFVTTAPSATFKMTKPSGK